jgi:hypothetical protein
MRKLIIKVCRKQGKQALVNANMHAPAGDALAMLYTVVPAGTFEPGVVLLEVLGAL